MFSKKVLTALWITSCAFISNWRKKTTTVCCKCGLLSKTTQLFWKSLICIDLRDSSSPRVPDLWVVAQHWAVAYWPLGRMNGWLMHANVCMRTAPLAWTSPWVSQAFAAPLVRVAPWVPWVSAATSVWATGVCAWVHGHACIHTHTQNHPFLPPSSRSGLPTPKVGERCTSPPA